jgi:hypothetical protein
VLAFLGKCPSKLQRNSEIKHEIEQANIGSSPKLQLAKPSMHLIAQRESPSLAYSSQDTMVFHQLSIHSKA